MPLGFTKRLASFGQGLPRELRGIGCMSTAAASSASMNGIVREVSAGLHSFEIAFFRNLFGFVALLPALIGQGRNALATQRLGLHLLRVGFHAVAMLSFFHAVTITPLATVAALSFTSPLFATILAMLVLKERLGPRRLTGLLIGFAGALLIIRPGLVSIEFGALLVLLSSMAWGVTLILIKILGRTESSLVTTSYATLFLLPITGLAAFTVWQTPNLVQWLQLALIGGLGSLTQLSIAQAFREADTTLVLPFDFTKLIWAALIGYWAFDEIPDPMAIAGGTIIFAAVIYITYREAQISRAKA